MLRRFELTESEFVVIAIVENVHQVAVERMNVFDDGKFGENERQSIVKVLLRVLDLAHVEVAYATDLVASGGEMKARASFGGRVFSLVYDGRRLSLRFRENYVDEVLNEVVVERFESLEIYLGRWDDGYLLETVLGHDVAEHVE